MEDLSAYNPEGSDLRKAQLKMLDILIEVAKICDQNNIPYWLSFGTLLGAVRHRGFIPWDDDLDIEVERKNYKKLLTCLERELPPSMTLQYEGNEKHYCFRYAKVRDRNSFIQEKSSIDFKEKGIFIDIFYREYSTGLLKKIAERLLGGAILYSKLSTYQDRREKIHQRLINSQRILLSECFTFLARGIALALPFNKLFISLKIGAISTKGIDKKYIFPLTEIYFEGLKFKSPGNPDACLKQIYGNYMKIPSPENRIVHATKIEFYNN